MTIIERLERQLANNEGIDHFTKEDIAAIVQCVRAQHNVLQGLGVCTVAALEAERKVGLE
jgi:hypothetical protein